MAAVTIAGTRTVGTGRASTGAGMPIAPASVGAAPWAGAAGAVAALDRVSAGVVVLWSDRAAGRWLSAPVAGARLSGAAAADHAWAVVAAADHAWAVVAAADHAWAVAVAAVVADTGATDQWNWKG